MTPRTALTTIAAAGAALALTACLDGSGGSSIDGIPDPLSSNQCDRPVPECEPGYTRSEGVDDRGRRFEVCDSSDRGRLDGGVYGVRYDATTGEARSYTTPTFRVHCDADGRVLAMYRQEDAVAVCEYACDSCPGDPGFELPTCDGRSPLGSSLDELAIPDGFDVPDAEPHDV